MSFFHGFADEIVKMAQWWKFWDKPKQTKPESAPQPQPKPEQAKQKMPSMSPFKTSKVLGEALGGKPQGK